MNTNTLLSIVATVVSAGAVFATLLAIWLESRHNNMSLRASMLRELINEFDYALRDERCELAEFLLQQEPENRIPYSIYAPVIDFFDTLGLHLRKGVLDLEMTWDMFYYWVGHYLPLFEKEISDLLEEDGGTQYYYNIGYLHSQLTKFGRAHRNLPRSDGLYSPERLRAFLMAEVAACRSEPDGAKPSTVK